MSQNKCWRQIAQNIQEGLMDVMRKSMFNDRPCNHDTQVSDYYIPV